jgi:DNA-binding NarL/FixJ family response regulator
MIADDHPIVRDGLRMTLERSEKDIVVVGEASDGVEVVRKAEETPADIYILDVTMPNMNGLEAARALLKKRPRTKIIMLSLHDTRAMVEEALAVGARGYLTKDTATRNVADAVVDVHAGRFYVSPSIMQYVVEAGQKGGKGDRKRGGAASELTGQERRVLQLIAEGQSNKEIGVTLGVATNTVHAHRTNLMQKLDLHKQTDLVRYAIREGIAKL